MTKRFIEFATQNTDNGEINNGFQDIKTGEWYYTKDSENAKMLCDLLNGLNDENKRLKQYTKQVLQNHLDAWRGVYNPIDESLVVEINVVKSIAEDLGVDLE